MVVFLGSILFYWSVCLCIRWYHTVLNKGKKCQASTFARLSQHYFVYSRSFVVSKEFYHFYFSGKFQWNYDTQYIKSVDHFGQDGYFHSMASSNSYTWGIFLFVSFPTSSISVLLLSVYRYFTSWIKLISKYFILFDTFEVELFSYFLFQIVCCWYLETQLIFLCYFVSCTFLECIS